MQTQQHIGRIYRRHTLIKYKTSTEDMVKVLELVEVDPLIP